MTNFLGAVVFLLTFIVFLGFFNEKVTKFNYEISLMLFSIIIGGVLLVVRVVLGEDTTVSQVLHNLDFTRIETMLMEGML